jgi:hypothetical protein
MQDYTFDPIAWSWIGSTRVARETSMNRRTCREDRSNLRASVHTFILASPEFSRAVLIRF